MEYFCEILNKLKCFRPLKIVYCWSWECLLCSFKYVIAISVLCWSVWHFDFFIRAQNRTIRWCFENIYSVGHLLTKRYWALKVIEHFKQWMDCTHNAALWVRPGSRGGLDLYKASSKKVKIAHSTKTKECEGINYPLQNMLQSSFSSVRFRHSWGQSMQEKNKKK